jgi:iron complex outermembrane receptor protein
MSDRHGIGFAVCLVCGLAGLNTHAFAETTTAQTTPPDTKPAGKTVGLEEIVVTARKRVENLQVVPVSVTAFSGEALKEQSVKTLLDVQGQVPGLYIQPDGGDIQSLEFTLRGRKQNDTASTLDASVGLYVDGLYSPRGIGLLGSLLDIDQFQVLRGPQGTLYGRNTTGGAILVNSNNPTNEFSASIDLTGGNLHSRSAVGILNLPITDNLAVRLVAERGKDDGWGHNANGAELASEDSQYYRAKLRATWGNNWEAVLSGHWEQNITGGLDVKLVGLTPANFQGNGLPEGGLVNLETQAELGLTEAQATSYLQSAIAQQRASFYDNGATTNQYSKVTRRDVALNISGDVADGLTFRSITGYQMLVRNLYFPSPIPVTFFWGQTYTESGYTSQEFQLLGTAGNVKWVTGLYGGYEDGADNLTSLLLPAIAGPTLTYQNNGIINTNAAAFAQGTWEFVPSWRLTGGVRYSRDQKKMNAFDAVGTACQVPAPGVESITLGPAQCPRWFQNTFTGVPWLISIDHNVTPDVLAYAKVSKGYRSGGENEGGAVEVETYASFRPETNIEYELGTKTEFFDHKLRMNFDVYYDDYTDLQVSTAIVAADGAFVAVASNAATAKVRGMELEGDVLLTSDFKVHYSAAYTDAYYGKFFDQIFGDRSHQPWTVPKWMGSLSGQYTTPIDIGHILWQLDYSWKGKIDLDGSAVLQSQVTQGPVGLLNGRVNLHMDAWDADIALYGKNITGKEYYYQSFTFESLGVNMNYSAPPRMFGVELVKHFGKGR